MIQGLYAAASAMIAGETRQRILSHNAANVETTGFKQTLVSLDDYLTTPVVDASSTVRPFVTQKLIGYQGLGVMTSPEEIDFAQGSIQETDQTYDLAIEGSGFFRVNTPDGERYTRDGRFLRNANGQLTTLDGYLVLNNNGQPIQLPEGETNISRDGSIQVDGASAGQIGLIDFENPSTDLVKTGENNYRALTTATKAATGTVNQGYLESSNVNTAQIMSQMVTVARAYEAAQKMVQVQDELLGQSISQLGRL